MREKQILSITNMMLSEVEALCSSMGEPAYRAKQILSWIYEKRATNIDQMTDLSEDFRNKLAEKYCVFKTEVDSITQTADGTEKLLIRLLDKNVIESVLLREGERITACVSSQVGCGMACRFCASGLLGLKRDLTSGEIVEQVLHVKNRLLQTEYLTNVVFMGIGEPLNNYDNVVKAVRIINAEWGVGIGARHITLSTVGVVDGIRRLAREGFKINLAISIHAPDDITRTKIVPSNKKTGIKNIIAAAKEYFNITRRDISFEYVLIEGINASRHAAESLVKLLKGVQCNINILPVNIVDEFNLKPPCSETIEAFCKTLEKCGYTVTLRKKKGNDINAACGQLRLRSTNFYGKN